MQCPRCSANTKEMSNHDVKIDVCYEGCGGIWFDAYELKKMDEKHEASEEFLKELASSQSREITLDKSVNCPKCEAQPLMRHFWSVKKSVEIDECPSCAGVWLDSGELLQIYQTFKTEADREHAAAEVFNDLFGPEMVKMKTLSGAKLASARKVANALRLICPSYYLPGKQDWGAF